jgi:hypothetical protein
MEADNASELSEDNRQYCSIGEAMKLLIPLMEIRGSSGNLLKMWTWFSN